MLARVGSTAFIEQMRRRGILVRDRSSDQGCEGCVRITLGPRAHTDRLLAALQETLEELGHGPNKERRRHEKRYHPTRQQRNRIQISLTIEGRGRYQVSTGIRFFDHMLELFAHHGGFDLKLKARGDLDVDQHHTVEDVGIVLGQAFDKALGSKRGILEPGIS